MFAKWSLYRLKTKVTNIINRMQLVTNVNRWPSEFKKSEIIIIIIIITNEWTVL